MKQNEKSVKRIPVSKDPTNTNREYQNNSRANRCRHLIRIKYGQSLKGKQKSEEHKRKISENHANTSGSNSPMYGRHHSVDTKLKMSQRKKGNNNPNYGLRYQWITDGITNKKLDLDAIIPDGFKKGKVQLNAQM